MNYQKLGRVLSRTAATAVLLLGACKSTKPISASPNVIDPNISFSASAEEIEKVCATEQKSLLDTMDQIGKTSEETANFDNTVKAIESTTANFVNKMTPFLFMKYVSADPKVRAAADVCDKAVDKLFVEIFAREDLYKAVKAASSKGESLEPRSTQLLKEYLTDFKRNGLELDEKSRKTYTDKKKELVLLESEFAQTLVEWKDHLEVSLSELDGLDEGFISSLEKTPEGKFKVTLAYPHYYPFMQSAKNAEARKKLQIKFFERGGEENKKRMEQAIKLRHELATLLGYKSHAEYVLEKRMAKNPETVKAFLDDLAIKLKPLGEKDIQKYVALKQKETGDASLDHIEPYDWRYYANQVKIIEHEVDESKIKEYFPIQVVVPGMFEIYETLLSVDFQEVKNPTVWHESVKEYNVVEGGKVIAKFYMDLFPRDGKYGHAAAFTISSGHTNEQGNYVMPISSIVANFNAPTEGKPSLLTHSQVETLFHEFGHIMHQVLTRAHYTSFSGTHVRRDFVEAPSQMLEFWCWEKVPLQKLSGHYTDTSKKLPDELIAKLVKAKSANNGITYLRQLMFATLDFQYHTSGPKVDTTGVYANLAKDIMLVPIPDGTIPQASFGHLMGGYDSGYYGYLWSEVYAADMYTRFAGDDLLSPKVGADYRKYILESGGEVEPLELITKFIGREPNNKAFLKELGVD